jgi:hypothetical protein
LAMLLCIDRFISAYQGGQYAGPVRFNPFRHPCFAAGAERGARRVPRLVSKGPRRNDVALGVFSRAAQSGPSFRPECGTLRGLWRTRNIAAAI